MTSPATANPQNTGRQAEVRKIKSQISQIDQRLDVVVEEYNSATHSLNNTKSELKIVSAKLVEAERESSQRQAAINKRVASLYREGGLSYLEVLLNTTDLDQFLYCLELVERLADRDARIIADLKESKKEAATHKAALVEKESAQKAFLTELQVKKSNIQAQLNDRNKLLARIGKEIANERRVEARKQAQMRDKIKVSYNRGGGVSVSRGEGRSGAVGIAMGELGKPYSWGAGGPNSFDCSGLTRYVYGQLGVSLPHSSRAQYNSGRRVSRDDLQSGDLVFFARGGTISHVGIYVGGGSFIHAPQTGDVVKISSLGRHGGYVGAVRP
ncbi:MAG: C40 family peptidase [Actinobacteria bacterium]|nr:C40 family peptidase [Actinomycetota bacterium]